MRTRTLVSTALAALVLALSLLTASPPAVAADTDGAYRRGIPSASTWTMEERQDLTRISLLASTALQNALRELFRTAEGTYQSGCVSNGFLCAAGTGFNVNVGAGLCHMNYVTGATADLSAFRVLQITAAEAATSWSANPGAATYYVHVFPGESRSTSGYIIPDPSYTIDTNASLAGSLTVCSIGVTGLEADATTYTITDLRTVLNGTHLVTDLTIGDDLEIGDDLNVIGDLTGGPHGGPTTWRVTPTGDVSGGPAAAPVWGCDATGQCSFVGDVRIGAAALPTVTFTAASGEATFGPAGTELFGVTAAGGIYLGAIGTEVLTCDATGAFMVAASLQVGPAGTELFGVTAAGDVYVGNIGAETLTVAGATGALVVGPAGAELFGVTAAGGLYLGAVGAEVVTCDATGDCNFVEDLTVGAVGAPVVVFDAATGAMTLGIAAAELFNVSAAALFSFGPTLAPLATIDGTTGAIVLGLGGAELFSVDAAALASFGPILAPFATIDGATGNVVTEGTVEGLSLDPVIADTDYLSAMQTFEAHLVCTGGAVCDQADSPIAFGPMLPEGAVIHWCMVHTTTLITSDTMPADAAAVAIGIVGDTGGIHAGLLTGAGGHDVGFYDGVPIWTVATFVGPLGAAQQLVATVTVDDVAAGIVDVECTFSVL